MINLLRALTQFFRKRKYRDLDRCDCRMEMKDRADVAALECLLIVCLAQECERHTVTAKRRLDDIRNVALLGLIIEVCEILAGDFLVTGQIVVGSVRNAPELTPVAEGERVLRKRRCSL